MERLLQFFRLQRTDKTCLKIRSPATYILPPDLCLGFQESSEIFQNKIKRWKEKKFVDPNLLRFVVDKIWNVNISNAGKNVQHYSNSSMTVTDIDILVYKELTLKIEGYTFHWKTHSSKKDSPSFFSEECKISLIKGYSLVSMNCIFSELCISASKWEE